MIKWILLVIFGLIGGAVGGMGMGGGTLLIPLLTIFGKIPQNIAQSINLIAFIPMSIVALIIHIKNKLVEKKGLLFIILPALVTAVLSSILVSKINSKTLSLCYGVFITLAGVFFLTMEIVKQIKEKKNNKKCDEKLD